MNVFRDGWTVDETKALAVVEEEIRRQLQARPIMIGQGGGMPVPVTATAEQWRVALMVIRHALDNE